VIPLAAARLPWLLKTVRSGWPLSELDDVTTALRVGELRSSSGHLETQKALSGAAFGLSALGYRGNMAVTGLTP